MCVTKRCYKYKVDIMYEYIVSFSKYDDLFTRTQKILSYILHFKLHIIIIAWDIY